MKQDQSTIGYLPEERPGFVKLLLYAIQQVIVMFPATVTVAPTGEVILVCAENHDTLLANIEKALAA